MEVGRVIAVLFSEEVTPEAAQDRKALDQITRYSVDGNQVVGVALQPGRRIALLALRDPVGPLVPRSLTAQDIPDASGQPMPAQTTPITMRVESPAGVVTGRVRNADGTPVPFADVRLLYILAAQQIFESADGSITSQGETGAGGHQPQAGRCRRALRVGLRVE